MFSYVLNSNAIFRIDSNFFQKRFLQEEKVIRKIGSITLAALGVELRSFGAYSLNNQVDYLESGVPFIRGVNMKRGRISFSDLIYIDKDAHSLLWKSEVMPEMVLLSMSGTIGEVAIASKNWNYPINSNQDIAKIDTKGKINPYFLYAFLLSNFGQNYLQREARGSVQQHVFLSQIEQFEIPVFSKAIECEIQRIVEKSDEAISKADSRYAQAETLLLDTLGMADFSPSTEAVNIKSFKNSFAATGRLDAEYYQPKYEDYQSRVFAYSNGWKPLAQACNLKDGNFTPDDLTTYKYIELADIDNSGGVTGYTEALGNELPSRARRKVAAGDVLISSIEGSLSSCAIVSEKMNDGLCSTGFYVINSDKINSETLLILFKSPLLQNLLKQGCSGTILTAINKTEFQNIPVPIIEGKAQSKIASLVQESFTLKAKSERLLDVAKRAVEVAIEQDEKAGMDYIVANS